MCRNRDHPPCAAADHAGVATGVQDADITLLALANNLVNLHVHVQAHTTSREPATLSSHSRVEVGSYTQVSIREMLKLVKHIEWCVACGADALGFCRADCCCLRYTQQPQFSGLTTSNFQGTCAMEAWCVYGSRFRSSAARKFVRKAIEDVAGWTFPPSFMSPQPKFKSIGRGVDRALVVGAVRIRAPYPTVSELLHLAQAANTNQLPDSVLRAACLGHIAAVKLLQSPKFIRSHGLVDINTSWLVHWVASASEPGSAKLVGACWYCQRLLPAAR